MPKLEQLLTRYRQLPPLAPERAERLQHCLDIDYCYNSNHIEGNTLTYGQTEALLMLGQVTGTGELRHFVDTQASLVAMRMMQSAAQDGQRLTQTFIRQLHHTLLREDYTVQHILPSGTHTTYTIHAGAYKTRPNSVITPTGERFDYATPGDTPALMADLVDWYNDNADRQHLTPIELAALLHYRYIRIHPFEDGNGRIARLLTNYALLTHHCPPIIIRTRDKAEYYNALHAADNTTGHLPAAGAHATPEQAAPFTLYCRQVMAQQLTFLIDFATDNSPHTWWHDGRRLTIRAGSTSTLLHTIRRYPDADIQQLAHAAHITPAAVARQLRQLMTKGYIQRDHNTHWHVLATPAADMPQPGLEG